LLDKDELKYVRALKTIYDKPSECKETYCNILRFRINFVIELLEGAQNRLEELEYQNDGGVPFDHWNPKKGCPDGCSIPQHRIARLAELRALEDKIKRVESVCERAESKEFERTNIKQAGHINTLEVRAALAGKLSPWESDTLQEYERIIDDIEKARDLPAEEFKALALAKIDET
jgi:hypothetical protein